jgi:hypothetical protein
MNKNKDLNNKQPLNKEKISKQADEVSLNKVLDALGAEASTYKHAGMTHISSLLAEAS